QPLSRDSRSNCFLIKLKQMNFLIDCGLNTSELIKSSPRDNLTSRAQTVLSEIDGINDDMELLLSGENEVKRAKLDTSVEPNGINGRRTRGQFLVETPEFSNVDWSTIDFILITNYRHMLALPYVTEYTDFKGKIYATEPTVIFGCQMMKELVHYFGESSISRLTKSRSHTTNGTKIFTGFTPEMNMAQSLYSLSDVQSCVDKIQQVRYGEKLMLFKLQVTAYSSGYCLGSANWLIDCDSEKISIISSSSIVTNIHPLPFSKNALSDANVVILNDLRKSDDLRLESTLQSIGGIVARVLRDKGNVLFPCNMNGVVFDIISSLWRQLNAEGLDRVPFYAISPIAEESLKYSNISGEWMCEERQQKMYLPENPMVHKDMIDKNLLFYAARADSSLQEIYREPCVVFAGHPSLRSGAAINFIRKWGNNSKNCMIFTESEYDFKEAVSAFEGLQITSEYLPIDIRLTVEEATNILQELKPRHVLLPREIVDDMNNNNILKTLPSSLVTFYNCLDNLSVSINSQYARTYMNDKLAAEIYPTDVDRSKLAVINANLKPIGNQVSLLSRSHSELSKPTYLLGRINVTELMNQFTQQI
ncbi:12027_t:CDS:2, partial [Acaulospora morrowiae]